MNAKTMALAAMMAFGAGPALAQALPITIRDAQGALIAKDTTNAMGMVTVFNLPRGVLDISWPGGNWRKDQTGGGALIGIEKAVGGACRTGYEALDGGYCGSFKFKAVPLREQTPTPAAQIIPVEDQRYLDLVAAAKANPAAADFAAMREAFVGSSLYDGYDASPQNLMVPGANPDEATVRAFVDRNYALTSSHVLATMHFAHPKGSDIWVRHAEAFGAISKVILASGDGRTPESAFKVLSVAEEYDMLMVLKLKRVSQALVEHAGKPYDLIVAAPLEGSGPNIDVYFDISAFFGR